MGVGWGGVGWGSLEVYRNGGPKVGEGSSVTGQKKRPD